MCDSYIFMDKVKMKDLFSSWGTYNPMRNKSGKILTSLKLHRP